MTPATSSCAAPFGHGILGRAMRQSRMFPTTPKEHSHGPAATSYDDAKRPLLVNPNAKRTQSKRKPEASTRCGWKARSIFDLTGEERLFVSAFVSVRDVQKAAEIIGISLGNAQGIYRQPHIHMLCDYECNRADAERMKLMESASQLTLQLADETLVRGLRRTQSSAVNIKFIELAYRRLGMTLGVLAGISAVPKPTKTGYEDLSAVKRQAREREKRRIGQSVSDLQPGRIV